jgi:protein-S-isoprenylcysteine O-methyltransferase Ste14
MYTLCSLAQRIFIFLYGVACYAIFFVTFLCTAGFLINFGVSKGIDSAVELPFGQALLVNIGLLAIFAVQHSVMARPAFKRWWTPIISAPAERSTYVLFSSVALLVLFAEWQPMGGTVWRVENSVGQMILFTLFGLGVALILLSSYLINHFDLFGLRQVWLHLIGRQYTPPPFSTPSLYKVVRHPLYVGWFFTFWATPSMTVTHLVFALGTTAYILMAVRWEERDLAAFHPEYEDYRRKVPMLIPRLRPGNSSANDSAAVGA